MSFYEEDFYYESSEFDIQVDQFKESLMKSVKEEFVSEMERLKKENEELQDVKYNFEKIKQDFEIKKRHLESDYQTLKNNVRRERLSQLMKELEVEMYTVASRGKTKPKCDKCDEERRIYYNTPSGRRTYESCECDSRTSVYEPIPILLSSFSIRSGEGNAWYKVVDRDRHDEYLSYYEDSISGKELITSEEQFESIGYAYKTLFKDKDIAQKYCDHKNNV
ncbi:hypothetical protein [Peribacillus acanthi]|uniref:hypothetical protein n=1 Tax=Peribacillus acanthi TaxID=2171554 RepID=UPI000D3EB678|nr:hypothetical protein [Peribacillus acanthi]